MKRVNPRKIAIALAILSIAALISGCGGANAPGAAPGASAIAPGAVAPGVAGLPAGCLSLSQPLGFTDQQGYVDSINIDFGVEPLSDPFYPGQTFGQTVNAIGGTGGPYTAPNQQLTISPDGSISMNATPVAAGTVGGSYGGGYGQGGSTALVNGTITISSNKQQLVLSELASAYPSTNTMNTMPGTIGFQNGISSTANSVCIVSLAGALSHNGFNLYGGHVYAYFYLPYMNTTMMGTMGAAINPATITGTALYNLPKIVLSF